VLKFFTKSPPKKQASKNLIKSALVENRDHHQSCLLQRPPVICFLVPSKSNSGNTLVTQQTTTFPQFRNSPNSRHYSSTLSGPHRLLRTLSAANRTLRFPDKKYFSGFLTCRRVNIVTMYLVENLYQQHGAKLGLELIAGSAGLKRVIRVPEVHRPGLSLSGYLKAHATKRLLVFGKVEIEYIRDLKPTTRIKRLRTIVSAPCPAIIVARRYRPPKELVEICDEEEIPLFRVSMTTMNVLSKLTVLLTEEFAPSMNCHGTLVEVFGVGVLIQGDSSVGKSEAALGLIERGHRLISDDIVKVRKREGTYLEGFGAELTRHHMEIRGIGIINVAHLYGAVCVRDYKSIDLAVKLEEWDDDTFYDRVGIDEKYCDMLGIKLPYHLLPVKPGRDVVLLLETIALNHRLKGMGYNSAKEFNAKLLDMLSKKQKKPGRRVSGHH
jgi:HPr kinase/phosphorylase